MNKRLFQIKSYKAKLDLNTILIWLEKDHNTEESIECLEYVIITLNNLVHKLQTDL